MFEQEVERTKKRLRQHLASQQAYIALRSILENTAIDEAYRAFFRAEVQWWIYEEQTIRSGNPRFDTSNSDIARLSHRLDELYLSSARFDQEELAATIDAAVKARLNMLCRPRTALKWFVFRGEPTRTVREILLRLDYLADHAYIADGVRSWLRSRGADASPFELVSVVEFERIVEKVDNEAILELSQGQFVALLDGMYEFFSEANPDLPPGCVPTEAVIIFLDDKGAIPISQALERLLYRESLTHVTRTKLLDVIDVVLASFDAQPATSEPVVAQAVTSAVESSPEVDTSQPTNHDVSEPVLELSHEPTTIDDEGIQVSSDRPSSAALAQSSPADTQQPSGLEQDSVHDAVIGSEPPSTDDVQGALENAEQTHEEQDPAGLRIARLREVMDERTLDKVIRKIFLRDKDLYERTVREVLQANTWKEAVGALDRFYAENDVEANSAVAMELSLAIRQSYRH
jgi:hypothetical protein